LGTNGTNYLKKVGSHKALIVRYRSRGMIVPSREQKERKAMEWNELFPKK